MRILLVTLVCSSLTNSLAIAQSYQGGLRGRVLDANGVVPGVEVTLANDETSGARAMVTNAVGEYGFANVVPGTDTVRASLAGFKAAEARAVRIGTQDFVLLDLRLEVGETAAGFRHRAASRFPRTARARW